jgi:hypothetical protein
MAAVRKGAGRRKMISVSIVRYRYVSVRIDTSCRASGVWYRPCNLLGAAQAVCYRPLVDIDTAKADSAGETGPMGAEPVRNRPAGAAKTSKSGGAGASGRLSILIVGRLGPWSHRGRTVVAPCPCSCAPQGA